MKRTRSAFRRDAGATPKPRRADLDLYGMPEEKYHIADMDRDAAGRDIRHKLTTRAKARTEDTEGGTITTVWKLEEYQRNAMKGIRQ